MQILFMNINYKVDSNVYICGMIDRNKSILNVNLCLLYLFYIIHMKRKKIHSEEKVGIWIEKMIMLGD